jgi:ketosteroid isomerase-like protein
MFTEDNKALVRRFYEESNKGIEAAMAAVEEYCAPDYVWHSPSPGVFPDVDRAGMQGAVLRGGDQQQSGRQSYEP